MDNTVQTLPVISSWFLVPSSQRRVGAPTDIDTETADTIADTSNQPEKLQSSSWLLANHKQEKLIWMLGALA